MLDRLSYDDARHEYRYDGLVVPNVTRILERLSADEYRGVPADVMERAAQLGKAVHKLIELDIKGVLDLDSLGDELQLYHQAWLNFCAMSGFVPLASERQVYSARYGYAGTLDMLGRLNSRLALVDAKRVAAVPRTAGPQTAAYEIAARESLPELVGSEPIDRYALHLRADGTWRLVHFNAKADQRVFLACLTLQREWNKAA